MLKTLRSAIMSKRWSLVQDLEADLHDLKYLFWESTRRCNLSCLHCGSDCGKDEGQPDLPGETGGEDDGGSSGCSASGVPSSSWPALALLPLFAILIRRRMTGGTLIVNRSIVDRL